MQVNEGKTEKSVTNEEAKEGMVCAEGWLCIGFVRLCLACDKTEYWPCFLDCPLPFSRRVYESHLNIIFKKKKTDSSIS